MSQADAENRDFTREVPDQADADARILRRARSGRNYDALRFHGFDIQCRDLVVAPYFDLCAEFSEVLNQVVCKRVVIIENEDHERCPVFSLHGEASPDEIARNPLPEWATPGPISGIDDLCP